MLYLQLSSLEILKDFKTIYFYILYVWHGPRHQKMVIGWAKLFLKRHRWEDETENEPVFKLKPTK